MNYQEYLEKAGVPEHLHVEALESLEHSKEASKLVKPYKLKAPFVLAWLVHKLKWEDEALPKEYEHYDNEVNINGDAGPWIEVNGVGVRQPVPLDDSGIQYCYWAKGHHPRSKWARWVWLGWRNRASMLAYDLGPKANSDIEHWGDLQTNNGHEGVLVMRMGMYWQIFACSKFGPFCIRRNVGVKVRNVKNSGAGRAMVVDIPWSLQGWKAK